MTRDDIIQMAREAGFADSDGVVHPAYQLEAFANLVTDHVMAQPEQEPDAQRFTAQQLRDYGSAEFERAVVLAMRATRPFGKTGDVIAVSIAHIKRSEA